MAVYQAQQMPAPLTATKPQRIAAAGILADVTAVRRMPSAAAPQMVGVFTATKPQRVAGAVALADVPTARRMPAKAPQMVGAVTATKPQRTGTAATLADVSTIRGMPSKAAQEATWERIAVRQSGASQPGQAARLHLVWATRGKSIQVTQHAGDRPRLPSDRSRRLSGKSATDDMWKLRTSR